MGVKLVFVWEIEWKSVLVRILTVSRNRDSSVLIYFLPT